MELGLEGRTALVTGASSGLGLGCARALAAEGVRVVMVSRNHDRLVEAAHSVEGATLIESDVSDRKQCGEMLDVAERRVGQIDIAITNAGGPPPGNFTSTDVDSYGPAIDLNLMPTIVMSKRLIPGMQQRQWGRIIAITSISVREPIGELILSNTARAGVTAFLKTTAREVAGDGVTVNSLQPGRHLTPRLAEVYDDPNSLAQSVPAGVLGDPGDFGRIATFLCSDSAKFITGAAIPVDGGTHRGLL